ncbi:MAG: T9SS type A sorting domain-containing protein [Candidatus Lokiarchaeota archaeon]|nr:T9SS type A sorting domain-containing protein [Candidatus Lokiarchaeota archaeon]
MQLLKRFLYFSCVLILLTFTIHQKLYGQSVVQFAQVATPTGVAVDEQGNVYVNSLSIFNDGGLYRFAPDGSLIGFLQFPHVDLRLTADYQENAIWAVEKKGEIYRFDLGSLQLKHFVSLKSLQPSTVLDILTGNKFPLYMAGPLYGDIAVRHIDRNSFDFFITGKTTSGGSPFVVRLRIQNQSIDATFMVTSFPSGGLPVAPPPLDLMPQGISVNSKGRVLTALPHNIRGGRSPFYLATFSADFPETNTHPPEFISNFLNREVFSTGMTTANLSGEFYIVTVANNFRCGAGPAVLSFPRDLSSSKCVVDLSSFGLGYVQPADIAVGPNDRFLYVTLTDRNLVLRIEHTHSNLETVADVPKTYRLEKAYPNPFNPRTTISYALPKPEKVHLAVYDVLGRQVSVLVNEQQPAGQYEVRFEGKDLPSGVYIYKIKAGPFLESKRMVLMK